MPCVLLGTPGQERRILGHIERGSLYAVTLVKRGLYKPKVYATVVALWVDDIAMAFVVTDNVPNRKGLGFLSHLYRIADSALLRRHITDHHRPVLLAVRYVNSGNRPSIVSQGIKMD